MLLCMYACLEYVGAARFRRRTANGTRQELYMLPGRRETVMKLIKVISKWKKTAKN